MSIPLRPTELLPHREPFLLVDLIDELVPGERVTARFRVPPALDVLRGHFPGDPIFPGVLQLEALAQAGACAVVADPRGKDRLPLFGGVEEVRFRRLVRPSEELVLEVVLERYGTRGAWGRGTVTVDGETACTARLLTVLMAPGGHRG